jgi:parvulin-like peptidyl-prolyl isomerase
MLGAERGKSGSLAAWSILGILAIAFGFGFGLPSDQLSMGESGLVKVYGEDVTKEDFVYQKRAISRIIPLPDGEEAQTIGVREEVLETVIERLVLNRLGEEMGLSVETRDAELLTKDGFSLVLGDDIPWPWAAQDRFDYELFKQNLLMFNVSEARYLEFQRQELLAQQVRELIHSSVTVPESELWAAYEKDNNQMSLRYVRFGAADYAEMVDPTDAEIDAYLADNADALQESWEINQSRFLKLPGRVDLRLIEFTRPVAPPADSAPELIAEHETKLTAARDAAAAARKRIVEGGESFAAVARELSRHADTARSGGRFGWTQVADADGGVGSGFEPIVDTTASTLADGQVSEVLEGEEALYLIMVAGRREGDVPEELAKRELAGDAVRAARGKELAKRAAEEALLAVQAGADLDKLFPANKPVLGDPSNPVTPSESVENFGVAPTASTTPTHKVEETGLFTYGQTIPGIGTEPKLSNTAWESDPKAPILGEVFEVPGGFLIAAVDERQIADKEGFAKARAALYRDLARKRGISVISGFTKQQCYLGKARVDIRVNEKQLAAWMNYGTETPTDENGIPLLPPYRVCARVGDGGGVLQMQMMLSGAGRPPG